MAGAGLPAAGFQRSNAAVLRHGFAPSHCAIADVWWEHVVLLKWFRAEACGTGSLFYCFSFLSFVSPIKGAAGLDTFIRFLLTTGPSNHHIDP